MTARALVLAPADDSAPWRWCVPDSAGGLTRGAGLDALAALLGVDREIVAAQPAEAADTALTPVMLVLPGEDVLATTVQVPTRSRRQLEAALPFVVEEYLAEDVESLHVVVADRAGSAVGVRVVAPARLDATIAALADAGFRAVSARVDADAPTPAANEVELWLGAGRVLIAGPSLRTACAPELATAYLADLEGGAVRTIRLRSTADADSALRLGELQAWLTSAGLHCETDDGPLADDLDAALASALLSKGVGPELLTGRWRPRSQATRRAPRWRPAIAALVAWIALATVLDIARGSWLEARTERLREDNLAHFREIMPGRSRSPDPRRELEALTGAGVAAAGAGFTELLGVVASALADAGSSELKSLNFNRQRGDLALDIAVSGIATVDALKARLETVGYGVTIDSAVQEQQGVRARVRIRTGRTDS